MCIRDSLSVVAGRAGVELAISEKSRASLQEIHSLRGLTEGSSWDEIFARLLSLCEICHPKGVVFVGLWGNSDYADERSVPKSKATKTFYVLVEGELSRSN